MVHEKPGRNISHSTVASYDRVALAAGRCVIILIDPTRVGITVLIVHAPSKLCHTTQGRCPVCVKRSLPTARPRLRNCTADYQCVGAQVATVPPLTPHVQLTGTIHHGGPSSSLSLGCSSPTAGASCCTPTAPLPAAVSAPIVAVASPDASAPENCPAVPPNA